MKQVYVFALLTALFVGEPRPAKADQAVVTAPVSTPSTIVAAFAKLPFIERPALSPDGRSVAGLFGVGGTQVIGIQPLFDKRKFIALGVPEGTQARSITWVNDENIIVGLNALLPVQGDSWYIYRLIGINALTGKVTRILWNLEGQNGGDVLWTASDGTPDILVAAQGSTYLGPEYWPAVYRVNVTNGHATQVLRGQEGVSEWAADVLGNIRTGLSYNGSSSTFRLLYRDAGENGSFKTINSANTHKRESLFMPFQFLSGRARALVMHDDEHGRSGIFETDLETRKDLRAVFVMPEGRAEVEVPLMSADGSTLLGVETTEADRHTHWIDPDLAELQAQFDRAVPGKRARIVSLSKDRDRMLVLIGDADMPGALYFYDKATGVLQKIAELNSDVGGRRMASTKTVHYRSRDGLEIEAILTLPVTKTEHKLPFIVMPHGGPWAHDTLGYDYWAQFLASKGYAVLQPNFRGSTGYGTDFLRAGEGQMGLAMQDDVTDGVRWAIQGGIADERRVCIVGASYGGYSAMWGIAKDPTLYRCAISIAGVANLRSETNEFADTLFASKFKEDWTRMTPNFEAVSPLNAVARITTPLLLVHGKKDITVDASQSSRMFARMQKAGKKVEFVSLPLADHYFTRQADRTTLLTTIGEFLDKYNPADSTNAQ